jgi:hypothetical protein
MGPGLGFGHSGLFTELTFLETIWARLTHRSGRGEEIYDYAQNQYDQSDYLPSIQMSTWVLRNGKFVLSKEDRTLDFLHPSFVHAPKPMCIDVKLDFKMMETSKPVIAIYLGTSKPDISARQFFLIAEETEDGAIRRVGLGRFEIELGVYWDFRDAATLTWLPGPKLRNSLNEWKHETLTLI